MARPMKPLVRSGGYYPSNRWIPLVYPGGYTTANGGGQPEPEAVLKTVTGSLIHITDALALPAEALSVNVEPIQDLHGYDRPWPAGGGKNLLQNTATTQTLNGLTFIVNSDGTVLVNGTATATTSLNINSSVVIDSSKTYILSGCPIGGGGGSYSLQGISGAPYDVGAGSSSFSEITGGGIRIRVASGVSCNNLLFKPMIRLASETDATFSPYSNICPISGWVGANIHVSPTTDAADGTTYSITFPSSAGTVYGGTLDVTSGVLTVDRAMVDLGTLNWEIDGTRFKASVDGMPNKAGRTIKMLCDCYKALVNGEAYDQNANNVCYGAYGRVYVHDFAYTDASIFKTAVTGHQLCYELATPIVYDLTPTEVTLLLGENNLFSDGEMTLVYLADGNASDDEALGILLGGRYTPSDDVTDKEALDIILGGTE